MSTNSQILHVNNQPHNTCQQSATQYMSTNSHTMQVNKQPNIACQQSATQYVSTISHTIQVKTLIMLFYILPQPVSVRGKFRLLIKGS